MSFSASDVSRAIAAQFGGCQDSNGSDDTELHNAALDGNLQLLEKVLSRQPSRETINQRSSFLGCTALRLAATEGHTACVERLVEHGANLDIPDVKGQTPLLVAVKNQHSACARCLLERGANPDGDPNNRSTPLSMAAMNGNAEMVQLLLDYGADTMIEKHGASGLPFQVETLQLAVAYQHFECCRLLLGAGAQPVLFPYHTLVTLKGQARFAQLLYEFGIPLWVRDHKGCLPWEVSPRQAGVVEEGEGADPKGQELLALLERLRGEPRSLRSCCRLCAWRQVRRVNTRRKKVSALRDIPGLPQSLRNYLSFQQL